MSENNILENLNAEQKQAVTHSQGPLLIVAGAGTGKTTVIAKRIAWLILEGKAKSNEILAMTFTDKAAGEMEERVDNLLPYGYVDLWVSTFHSFGERILHQHALEIGLPDDFKLLSQTEQALLMRKNFERFDLDYYKPLGNPTKFVQALVKHFSRCKDEIISPAEYLKFAEEKKTNQDNSMSGELLDEESRRWKEIANAFHTYQQLLLENNALDFGDLINYTLKLFKTRPAILDKYRRQFKYILVDEFQDTNYAQYELIKLLTISKKSSESTSNLTVCADDDQSIYKFRGASVSNVLQFRKDFPQAKNIVLIKNYRSWQAILDLAYQFIQLNNPNRLEAQLRDNQSLNIDKKLIAQQEGSAKIEHFHLKTQEEEAEKVIAKILEIKEKNKDASLSDFAILVRANHQADLFIQALSLAGISYEFLASSGLYQKPIILDILAYLRLLDNYHESSALYRILNSPIFRIKPADLKVLTYYSRRKNWSLYETLQKAASLVDLSQESLKLIAKLLGLIEKHGQLARENPASKIIFSFLEDTGYLKLISHEENQANLASINWLNQFFKRVEEFERVNQQKSVGDFLEFVDLSLESGDMGSLQTAIEEEGPESVKILTIHGAKGLEFKYVFLVNLVDRRFPTIERGDPIELPDELVKEIIPEGDIHLQEERRLFYVGMTRAKQGLFFTSAEDYGGTRKKKLSRFLIELGLAPQEIKSEKNKISGKYKEWESKAKVLAKKETALKILPKKFSFTQLKAFEICPLQYKFAHIFKIPVRGKWTFSFGKTMHLVLQKFYQRILENQSKEQKSLFEKSQIQNFKPQITASGGIPSECGINSIPQFDARQKSKLPVSLDELLRIYSESWIDDWYADKSQQKKYRQKGEEILKEFYKKISAEPVRPKFLELGFNFSLGDYTLKGKMDRVDDLGEGKIEIIDYKTGQPKFDKKLSLEDKEQLLIYQMAGEQLFGDKVEKLTFYYLDNNQPVSFLGEQPELEKIKEKIIRIIEQIKQSDFPATPSSHKCQFCDFKDICEYRMR